MGRDTAKRQKRLAKHAAKRAQKRRQESIKSSKDPALRLQSVENWEIHETLLMGSIFEEGMGAAFFSRRAPDGQVAYAALIVDSFCLGVKNVVWDVLRPTEYNAAVRRLRSEYSYDRVSPEYLVKFIKGAVDYAKEIGFRPHPDYRHCERLFQGVDPSLCTVKFSYGKDGNPYYIRGPKESVDEFLRIAKKVKEQGGDAIFVDGPSSVPPQRVH